MDMLTTTSMESEQPTSVTTEPKKAESILPAIVGTSAVLATLLLITIVTFTCLILYARYIQHRSYSNSSPPSDPDYEEISERTHEHCTNNPSYSVTRASEPLNEAAHSSEAGGGQTADVNTVIRSLGFENESPNSSSPSDPHYEEISERTHEHCTNNPSYSVTGTSEPLNEAARSSEAGGGQTADVNTVT